MERFYRQKEGLTKKLRVDYFKLEYLLLGEGRRSYQANYFTSVNLEQTQTDWFKTLLLGGAKLQLGDMA